LNELLVDNATVVEESIENGYVIHDHMFGDLAGSHILPKKAVREILSLLQQRDHRKSKCIQLSSTTLLARNHTSQFLPYLIKRILHSHGGPYARHHGDSRCPW